MVKLVSLSSNKPILSQKDRDFLRRYREVFGLFYNKICLAESRSDVIEEIGKLNSRIKIRDRQNKLLEKMLLLQNNPTLQGFESSIKQIIDNSTQSDFNLSLEYFLHDFEHTDLSELLGKYKTSSKMKEQVLFLSDYEPQTHNVKQEAFLYSPPNSGQNTQIQEVQGLKVNYFRDCDEFKREVIQQVQKRNNRIYVTPSSVFLLERQGEQDYNPLTPKIKVSNDFRWVA